MFASRHAAPVPPRPDIWPSDVTVPVWTAAGATFAGIYSHQLPDWGHRGFIRKK